MSFYILVHSSLLSLLIGVALIGLPACWFSYWFCTLLNWTAFQPPTCPRLTTVLRPSMDDKENKIFVPTVKSVS